MISLTVERIPGERGYYRDVEVFEDETGLHVTGFVKRFIEPGYVHVELIDSDGAVFVEKCIEVDRPLGSSRVRHAHFDAVFEPTVARPVKVQIEHHHLPDKDRVGS